MQNAKCKLESKLGFAGGPRGFGRTVFLVILFLVSNFQFPIPAGAWQSTPADLSEAFLLWATPRAEYSGNTKEDGYAILMADSPAAARVLPGFLETPSGSIRDKILTLCENMGPVPVGPAFREHAAADSPQLAIVMYCLSRAHDTGSLPILLEHLKHRRWQIRSSAALALGYLAEFGALDGLMEALNTETYPMARKSVVFALGQCADSVSVTPHVLDALIAALDNEYFAVRFNASRALTRLADPAVARILEKYDELSDTARYGALHSFGRSPSGLARAHLEKTARDTAAALPLRGIALKGLLDQKWAPADTDLEDLRGTSVGRGLWGLIR